MSLTLAQTKTALAVNCTASFLANGGTAPYAYAVQGGGAGGTIDPASGLYTAPAVVNGGNFGAPTQLFDTIQVTDSVGAMVTAQILVGSPLLLFCDIIQQGLGLNVGRVYLWDQKIPEPNDAGLFVVVSVLSCKPFASKNKFDGAHTNTKQSVNMYAQLQVDIQSRNTEARDRKEEVILVLNSDYSNAQQEANNFSIGKLPPGSQFVNLSNPDGAAIPYRYTIAVGMQYAFEKTIAVPYFDSFPGSTETIEP